MTANSEQASEVAFGPFRLDLSARTLYREGTKVGLGGRSIGILCELAAKPGDLVTKDALVARVWSGAVVEDNTIQVHVSALRRVLEAGSDGRRFILTVPGKGYRLIAELPATPPHHIRSSAPTHPSIAVLPFQNMSADPEQDYFADGIVEEITTALSRIRWLFVIARNSSFAFKRHPVDVRRVSAELGVRYVLEGSVRKAGARIRITTQLIEATTGIHVWADNFEGELSDLFDLQSAVATKVVGALAPQLEQAEIARARRTPTCSLQAYDFYLRGLAYFHEERREANEAAMRSFANAIKKDPDFAAAHGMAALCYSQRLRGGFMLDRQAERAEAKRLARRAVELGKDDSVALAAAGGVLALVVHEVEVGASLIDRALALNPNHAYAWGASAWARVWLGDADLAIEHAARGMRLSPLDPQWHMMATGTAFGHFIASRYDEATSWAERSLCETPHYQGTLRVLATSHALAGRIEQAASAMAEMRALNPTMCISDLVDLVPFRRPDDFARYVEGLRRSGLPDCGPDASRENKSVATAPIQTHGN